MDDPKTDLMAVKEIKLGHKVLEMGYEGFPVLGTTSVITCFLNHSDPDSNGWKTTRLALTVRKAKQLVRDISTLLEGYKEPEESSTAVQ